MRKVWIGLLVLVLGLAAWAEVQVPKLSPAEMEKAK